MTLDEQTTAIATETPSSMGRRASRLKIIDSDMHPTVRLISEIKPFFSAG